MTDYFNLIGFEIDSIERVSQKEYVLELRKNKTEANVRYKLTIDMGILSPVLRIFVDSVLYDEIVIDSKSSKAAVANFFSELASLHYDMKYSKHDNKRDQVREKVKELFG
jgi:hypothetical protein